MQSIECDSSTTALIPHDESSPEPSVSLSGILVDYPDQHQEVQNVSGSLRTSVNQSTSRLAQSEDYAGENIHSRRVHPFYFTTRRAEVPNSCVPWDQPYINPLQENDEFWDLNERYSVATNGERNAERNPKGRTGLHETEFFFPKDGANTILYLVITRNAQTYDTAPTPNGFREVLVCKPNSTSHLSSGYATPEPKWLPSPPGQWSLPVFDGSTRKDLGKELLKESESKYFSKEFVENFPENIQAEISDMYLDDPRNSDSAWIAAAAFRYEHEIKNVDMRRNDYLFRWINFDLSVISAHDIYSGTQIVIKKCILEAAAEQQIPTPEKGTFNFQGNPAVCKYVKIGNQEFSDCKVICKELFSGPRPDVGWWRKHSEDSSSDFYWVPAAIISVTGGAQDFKMGDSSIEEDFLVDKIFRNGILRAAVSMKALIVDGGFSAGVMKQLGRAVAEDGNRVATLGICPWAAISERNQISPQSSTCTYRIESGHRNSAVSANLDENHRFFAFIDSKRLGNNVWGTEINMRYNIECALAPTSAVVPHVLVVVNGGVNTIETVHKLSAVGHATQNPKCVPIVVVEGSGKAADFIACTWRHFHCIDSSKNQRKSQKTEDSIGCRLCLGSRSILLSCISLSSSISEVKCKYLQEKFESYFGTTVPVKKRDSLLKKVVEVCVRKEAVTVYNFEDNTSLSHAIMKGVCMGTVQNGQSYTSVERMKLLEKWNTVEAAKIARTEIFNVREQELNPADSNPLKSLLVSSLKKNRVVFVELLLDFGVELIGKPEGSENYLDELYKDNIDTADDDQTLEVYLPSLRILHFVRKLGQCKAQSSNKFNVGELVLRFMGWEEIFVWDWETKEKNKESVTREDLFLWAILTGRLQLAELFWRRCDPELRQHSITRALFACAIANTLGARLPPVARGLMAGSNTYPEHQPTIAEHFESIACEILDLCYHKSRNRAVSVLMAPMVHCSKYSWMDRRFSNGFMNSIFCFADHVNFLNAMMLAHDAKAYSFVSHEAVQECLDEIWTGRIMIFDDPVISNEQELGLSDPKGVRFRHKGILSFIPTDGYFVGFRMHIANLDVLFSAILVVPILLMKRMQVQDKCSNPQDESLSRKLCNRWDELSICFSALFWVELLKSWAEKLCAFYSAPVTKFWLDCSSYLTFLVLYTHAGLCMDYEFSRLEIIVNIWILALVFREFWEYFWDGKRYFNSMNNVYDVIMVVFYIPSIWMRINERWGMNQTNYNSVGGVPQSDGTLAELQNATLAVYQSDGVDFLKARSWHGLAGIIFWIRLSDFFRVSRTLGPLTQVLLKVSRDSLLFFLFLLVFIISFGSAIICASRPRADPGVPFQKLIEQAVYLPYMAIFGEHHLSGFTVSIVNNPSCDLEPDSSCSSHPKLGIILYSIYLFVSTIILLNLLIASETLFSDTQPSNISSVNYTT